MPLRQTGALEVKHHSFFNLSSRWGGWRRPRPGRFIPIKDSAPIAQESGRALGPFYMNEKNLTPPDLVHRTSKAIASRYKEYPVPDHNHPSWQI